MPRFPKCLLQKALELFRVDRCSTEIRPAQVMLDPRESLRATDSDSQSRCEGLWAIQDSKRGMPFSCLIGSLGNSATARESCRSNESDESRCAGVP